MTITNATRLVMCALAVLGVAFSLEAQVFQQEEAQPQQPGQLQQLRQPEPKVVATVNGDAITEPELESTLTRQLAALQQRLPQGQPIDPATAQEMRQKVLDNLIESRLIEQYVIEEGPDVEQAEVQAKLGQVKEQVQTQGVKFNEFLAAQGLTEENFEKRIEGSLAWKKYQEEAATEPKLQEYFEQNKDRFAADNFQEARPEVIQAYTASIWEGIVKEKRPEAEIEMKKEPGEARSPAERPVPGDFPQQQP